MAGQARLVTADRDRPLRAAAAFVALTFLIATAVYLPLLARDLGWIAVTLPPGLPIVGILSPGIATVLLRLADDGLAGVRGAFAGLASPRFGARWWAVALALPPAIAAGLAAGLVALGEGSAPAPLRVLSGAGPAFLGVVLLTLVLSVGEEMGWRGHLQPLLQARLSALAASLVVGVVWAVWHLPVFYGSGVGGWLLVLRFLSTIPAAVLFAWLFNNTGGSLLAVTVLHAGINVWPRLFDLRLTGHPAVTLFTAEIALVAVALLAGYGGATLTGRRGRTGR